MIREGVLPDSARLEIEVDAARQIDAELTRGAARTSDKLSDDFVSWNFKRTWRTGQVRKGDTFGTDYDYYTEVAKQAKALWTAWTSGSPDPDVQGLSWYGGVFPEVSLSASLGIWQNGVEVSFGQPLEGPQIDIGPKVDYGLFLEKWRTIKGPRAYQVVLEGVGAVHAIAYRLNADWGGAHHIYPAVSDPRKGSKAPSVSPAERVDRKTPINLFPFIRIQPRHR